MAHANDLDWDRLQKYLPANLYRQAQYAVPGKRETMCIDHLNRLLRAVVSYVPRHLALELLQEPVVAQNTGQFLEGTLLFADISGFTILSEKLKEMGGKAGAEEVVRVINSYLDVMLGILFKHNGLLIKFGGDAMLCLFTGKDHGAMNALWAAWEMKQMMIERFDSIEVFQLFFPLSMKVGSNSGLLFAASVGAAERMEYILTGSVVERTARAESAANRGDVLVSHETYELVKDNLEAEELAERPGFYRVIDVRPAPVEPGEDRENEIERLFSGLEKDLGRLVERLDALTPYLPAGILPQLVYDPQQGQIEGQHRQVTILFANFIGMSQIIRARGVADEAGIASDLSQYFQAMQEEVQYYGGAINKVDLYDQGDKLMVTFGAPKASERDARRAALTALAMQEAMARLSSPTVSAFLSQRIGINTGFVFAGNVGSSECKRREYTVMGDDVNLAARLMSAAKPGQILVSQSVWAQIGGSFEVQALDPIRVKGKRDLVPIYLLQAAGDLEDRIPLRVVHSDMVGRETELATLQRCFRDLLSRGRKRIAAVTGKAGVGKTRLIEEWRQWAATITTASRPTRWLTARGHAYGQRANGVLIEVVERLLAFDDDDTPEKRWSKLSAQIKDSFAGSESGRFEEFSNKLAYLGNFLALDLSGKQGLAQRVARLDAQVLQLQTNLAVCDLLTRAAQGRPLVLILEDLHWADVASLEMLRFVLDRVSDRLPLLFCLLYRPKREHPIWQTWQEIERGHPGCRLISLRELESADCRQLLSNMLQADQAPPDFQKLILRATDGNPLYVEEVLRSLIDEGVVVYHDEAGWQIVRSVDRIHVPDTLQQIIQSRIDELDFASPGARRVLWMASVIGEKFAEDLLLHLFTSTGRGEEEFFQHLRELRRADMVQEVESMEAGDLSLEGGPQWMYQFRHGLLQQVAYENMLVARRRDYHCQVGRWLESRHSEDLQRHYDALAYHYDQGGRWEEAFKYHRLAGEKDVRAYTNQNAILHLQRALAVASHVAPGIHTLGQVHFELAKVQLVIGEFDDALNHLTEAWALFGEAREQDAVLFRARVCYHIGRVYEQKGGSENLEAALEWQGKGLALLPDGPTAEAALLHTLGGIVSIRQRDLDRAIQESERALSVAQATDAKRELGFAHRMLSISYRAQGRLDLAMSHCQSSIAVCEELSDLIGLAKDYSNQGVIALEVGDWQLARKADLKAVEMLERVGEKYQLAMTCCNLADKLRRLGDLERGFDYAQRGLDLFAKLGSPQGMVFAHAVLAPLYWRGGELESARAELLEARALIERHNVVEFVPTVGRWLAQVYRTEGDIARAESEIQALPSPEALGIEAEPVQRLRGQLLTAQGKLGEAVAVLEESLDLLEQRGERYETGLTLLALAGVLTQMEGRVPESRAHAERARAIFSDLGAGPDLQETDELMARI